MKNASYKNPVSVLQGNVIYCVENADENSLARIREAVGRGVIVPKLDYLVDENKVVAPHANSDAKTIVFEENYLSFLWAYIYGYWVTYEDGIQRKQIEGRFNGFLELDSPLLQRAGLLLSWSKSLVNTWSEWDIALPNPLHPDNFSAEEVEFIVKSNGLFTSAVAFSAWHEIAHFILGHANVYRELKEKQDKTDQDYADLRQMELDADDFAMSVVVGVSADDKHKVNVGLGLLLLFMSNFSLVRDNPALLSRSHPTLDVRLHKVLEYLGFESEERQYYFWYLAALCLKDFLVKNGVASAEAVTAENARELFMYYLSEFDRVRESIGGF